VKTATENTARAFALAAAAWAGPDDDRLIINEGIEIVTETVAPARMEYFDTIYSGWRFRSDETQAVQADGFGNPAHRCGSNAFWLLDVVDYFPSCTANNVARFFRRELECSPDVTAVPVRLTTLRDSLPQGSPCSPILAYFSNRLMWDEIDNLARGTGCKMNLYADDIAISS